MDAHRTAIEKDTGVKPESCPWAAHLDPRVGRTQRAYWWAKKGDLRAKEPDPPAWLVLAVEHYGRTLERLLDLREAQRIEALKEKAKQRDKGRNRGRRPPRKRGR